MSKRRSLNILGVYSDGIISTTAVNTPTIAQNIDGTIGFTTVGLIEIIGMITILLTLRSSNQIEKVLHPGRPLMAGVDNMKLITTTPPVRSTIIPVFTDTTGLREESGEMAIDCRDITLFKTTKR